VTVIHPDQVAFDSAVTQFDRYDDQAISLVDHLTGVLANERDDLLQTHVTNICFKYLFQIPTTNFNIH
jgi:hypothetical protein